MALEDQVVLNQSSHLLLDADPTAQASLNAVPQHLDRRCKAVQ